MADSLTPSQFIALDKSQLRGLILQQVGSTSHTVILARSFNIPILTGIRGLDGLVAEGQEVVVDANIGILIPEINHRVERFYDGEQKKSLIQQQRLMAFKNCPAETHDGIRLEVMANVATADEVSVAMERGAEGIGLFRTEMLFMDRDRAPGEEEQFKVYRQAVEAAGGYPVMIRTFDIGGDKAIDYIPWDGEGNPFLGNRGVRVYRQNEVLFKNQLRAILRASAYGQIKIMIPMVSCREEVVYVRTVLETVKLELDAQSIRYDQQIALGIMAEVPSIGFIIPQLAGLIDFFEYRHQ